MRSSIVSGATEHRHAGLPPAATFLQQGMVHRVIGALRIAEQPFGEREQLAVVREGLLPPGCVERRVVHRTMDPRRDARVS
jgi:hypothetical protein